MYRYAHNSHLAHDYSTGSKNVVYAPTPIIGCVHISKRAHRRIHVCTLVRMRVRTLTHARSVCYDAAFAKRLSGSLVRVRRHRLPLLPVAVCWCGDAYAAYRPSVLSGPSSFAWISAER